jgi:tripartite-type tricarboxylate transporter receptor subunit TctC
MKVFLAILAVCFSYSSSLAAGMQCSLVRLIVPYAAAGAADIPARIVAERLQFALKTNFIVENRPGATGNIGTLAVINSKPDGCTLLVNASVIATFPYSFAKLGFDPSKDLVPIGGIASTPTIFVTASSNPPTDIPSLLKWGGQKSGGLSFSTAGYGLLQHLAVEAIIQSSGLNMIQVPYKAGSLATGDLISGRVDFGSFAAGSILPLVRDGKLRTLAVIQEKRSKLLPDVPTAAEQGFGGLNASVHFMLFAPAGTPMDLVQTLDEELKKIISDPSVNQKLLDSGFDATPLSSREVTEIMRNLGNAWAPIIRRLDIKL